MGRGEQPAKATGDAAAKVARPPAELTSRPPGPHAPRPARRTPKFRRRAEARPDEVLDAALDLFIEKGFAAARVEDIARRAGLSKGAIYLYFSSKEAIMEALVRRAVVPITQTAGAALADFKGSPRDAFMMLFALMSTRLADPRVLAIPKLIVREVGAFPELAAMYRREVIERGLPLVTELVRRGVESGAFRPVDPELAVRSIIGPIGMHLLLAEIFGMTPNGGLNLKGLIESHIDILYNGLVSEKGRVE
ncbi:MAG: TetR/AcrR family transcriptional regulator [Devosia sp.]|nr:TetR/AcrR family transcriptional regulator [Devosia sp.]